MSKLNNNREVNKSKMHPLDAMLARIGKGEISNKDAAAELGVSTRTISRRMVEYGVKRPEGQVKYQRAAAKETKELRDVAAASFATGSITLAEAAEMGQCSSRTIYRRWSRMKVENV